MKIFVIVIIFLAGIELSPAGIPYPPDEIWSGAASVPTVARPDYLSTIIDPTFSTEVTRITSLEGWRNHYPKDQAWNCDATMLKLVQPYSILNAQTYAIIITNGPYGESRWSYTDPQKLYHIDDNHFMCFTVSNQANVTLRTFTNYSDVYLGPWEGNLSTNDKYVALAGEDGTNVYGIIYDIENNIIETEEKMPFPFAALDWMSMSQSGDYVVMSTTNGVCVYDRALTFLRTIASYGEHGDLGVDTTGHEVFVPIIPLQMIRLDNGATTNLLDGSSKVGGGHVSCRNFKRPGWAYVSARDSHHEVFAIKLDGSRTVEHFVHDHNTTWSAGATASPDGRKIIFNSSWGTGTTYYVYVAHMPECFDMDFDGIPDAWEELYGTTNMFSGGTSDCDGDGASDYHEYISDTIPTSNLSFFQINTLQHTNYHSVTFACSTSRVYSLQYATNPVLNSWSTVDTETNITGETDGTLSLDDTNTYPFNCYRVRVALP